MLNHRVTSVVGFLAALLVPIVLRERPKEVEGSLEELIHKPTDSGRFFGNLLLAHLAYLEPKHSVEMLGILHRRILPWFVEWQPEDQVHCLLNWEWPTLFTLCIAAVAPDTLWPDCHKILTEIITDLDQRGDPVAAARLGDHLLKAAFLRDGDLGRRVFTMLIDDGRLEQPLWREAVLKVAAGLLARSPAFLQVTLSDKGMDNAIERAARDYLSPEVLYQRDTFSGQVSWDRAMINILADNSRFRYLANRDLLGGLARAKDSKDIGVALRHAIVNTAVIMFDNELADPDLRLSVDEMLGA
jgi:hypothetical protein